ncbi:MAG: hypothetical protein GY820_27990, partial [Gammaproteobacteria bacterium]|nr:hypothetical protein [Gammaproteobacteria bacterium]
PSNGASTNGRFGFRWSGKFNLYQDITKDGIHQNKSKHFVSGTEQKRAGERSECASECSQFNSAWKGGNSDKTNYEGSVGEATVEIVWRSQLGNDSDVKWSGEDVVVNEDVSIGVDGVGNQREGVYWNWRRRKKPEKMV